jgi:hypothetical protein
MSRSGSKNCSAWANSLPLLDPARLPRSGAAAETILAAAASPVLRSSAARTPPSPRRWRAARSASRAGSSPSPSTAPRAARRRRDGRTTRRWRGACRLVEADVPVHPQPKDLQIDAAGAVDRAFVAAAFPLHVAGRAVQEMYPARRQVDVIEQLGLHESAITAWIARVEADEFVEVEGRGAAEIGAAETVQPDQLAIQRDRRSAGRQAENHRRLPGKSSRDVHGQGACERISRRKHTNADPDAISH